ncbi:MAG: hypothetical protein JO314_14305 [Acidobacteria bacterium]|nr:hypothetical protein [Acidobacteriota bacterium]
MIFETIRPHNIPGRWAKPQATINANGQIKISRVAFELLGMPEYFSVLFDKQAQTIALKRTDRHDTAKHECIAHGRHGAHGGRLIKVHGLVEHIEAELFTCMRFTDVRLDPHNRLILDLTTARCAYHGKRIGVYNEWRLKHDAEYAAKKREQYAKAEEAKRAAETDEERAVREDRWLRELEYRKERRREKEERLAKLREEKRLAREGRKAERIKAAADRARQRLWERHRKSWENNQRGRGLNPYPNGRGPVRKRKKYKAAGF